MAGEKRKVVEIYFEDGIYNPFYVLDDGDIKAPIKIQGNVVFVTEEEKKELLKKINPEKYK